MGIELFNLGSVSVTRYRFRGNHIPFTLDSSRGRSTHGMTLWRAGCGESRTSGSVGVLGKRIPSNRDTAPQVDPTNTGGPQM